MSFASDLRRYADAQKKNLKDVAAESLINLSASIIIKTPVDKGVAANSWQPTMSAPARGERVISGPASQLPEVQTTVTASIGDVYFLVSNLPYIRRLEYESWSEKAPRGMVRVSIEEYQNFIDQAIANI